MRYADLAMEYFYDHSYSTEVLSPYDFSCWWDVKH